MTEHLWKILSLGNCDTDLDFFNALKNFSDQYSKGQEVFNNPTNRMIYDQQPYDVKTVTVYLDPSLKINPSLKEIVSKNLRDTVIIFRDYNPPHNYLDTLFFTKSN